MGFRRDLIARCAWVPAAAATALAASVAPPVKLVFSGVDASAEPVRVVLVDPATKARAWVPVGCRFEGCEVRAYDARRQTLTLARKSSVWELALDLGVATAPSPSPEERQSITKRVTNNLRQLAAASDQYFLEYGATTVRMDQLVGRDRYIVKIDPADGEDYSTLDFTQPSPTSRSGQWTITTKRGVTVRYDR